MSDIKNGVMVGDDQVVIEIQAGDTHRIANVINAWADASAQLPDDEKTTRVMFLACVQIIKTCGPAYCRIAKTTFENDLAVNPPQFPHGVLLVNNTIEKCAKVALNCEITDERHAIKMRQQISAAILKTKV